MPPLTLRQQWQRLRPRLFELAEELERFAWVSERNLLFIDLKGAKKARNLAFQVRRLARRTLTAPLYSGETAAEQFQPLFSQYNQLRRQANNVMADWKAKTRQDPS